MTLLTLAWEFFKTGLLATGGGLATLPFLQQMSVSHPEWFSLEMLADMVAVSESTPGPLGVNMATYVGYTVGGVAGALEWRSLALFVLVLAATQWKKLSRLHPIVYIGIGAVAGMALGM